MRINMLDGTTATIRKRGNNITVKGIVVSNGVAGGTFDIVGVAMFRKMVASNRPAFGDMAIWATIDEILVKSLY